MRQAFLRDDDKAQVMNQKYSFHCFCRKTIDHLEWKRIGLLGPNILRNAP